MALSPETAIRRFYAGWNRGDLAAMLRVVDPEVTADCAMGFLDDPRIYHGHAGIAEMLAAFVARWDAFDVQVTAIDQRGELVLASVGLTAHRTGRTFAGRAAAAYGFRGGRIASVARAPVGL